MEVGYKESERIEVIVYRDGVSVSFGVKSVVSQLRLSGFFDFKLKPQMLVEFIAIANSCCGYKSLKNLLRNH